MHLEMTLRYYGHIAIASISWSECMQIRVHLTHWGRNKMDAISQTTFSNASFFNENEWISLQISLKFVLKGTINNIPAWVQIMAWRRSGDKPLSKPMMVSLPTHIWVTWPQWVNALWPGGSIWQYSIESALVQAMACCFTATSHYVNHFWKTIRGVLWHSSGSNKSAKIGQVIPILPPQHHLQRVNIYLEVRVWWLLTGQEPRVFLDLFCSFSALLALGARNLPVTGEFLSQRPSNAEL